MPLTPAQLKTLRDMLQHGGRAHRVRHKNPRDWTWNIGGKPRSGTVDRLYKAGLLQVLDTDTLELSAKARSALGVSAAAEDRAGRNGCLTTI
jgi:hypothetical protein